MTSLIDKLPWGDGTPWKTQSSFMSWVRGGIRRGLWNKSPIKLGFLNKHRKQIDNPNPRGNKATVWGGECALCNGVFTIANLEVDHKEGNHSLNSIEDIHTFIEAIVLVTEDDLQLVCKPCHKIKSYSDKEGISFQEARAEKKAIQTIKEKKDKETLKSFGIIPAPNQKERRKQLVELFKEEE